MTRWWALPLALMVWLGAAPAFAQAKPAAPAKPSPTQPPATRSSRGEGIGVRGFVTFGNFTARAAETFDAVLGANSGPVFGGGGQVLLPRGLYVELSAARFRRDGERVFIGPNQQIFPLGIPVEVTLTPLEITGGWRYRHCPRTPRTRTRICRPTVVPYVGGGLSSYRYQETSQFSDGDDVDARFSGFHALGGVEYRALAWLAVGGEFAWSSIADALGDGGVAAVFEENNLGGTTLRVKISVGR